MRVHDVRLSDSERVPAIGRAVSGNECHLRELETAECFNNGELHEAPSHRGRLDGHDVPDEDRVGTPGCRAGQPGNIARAGLGRFWRQADCAGGERRKQVSKTHESKVGCKRDTQDLTRHSVRARGAAHTETCPQHEMRGGDD
jgi:hypothetical protein